MNVVPWDNLDKDPHGIVPMGFYCPVSRYTVVSFSAPMGLAVTHLVVHILYDGSTPGTLSSTTRSYVLVLYDYFQTLDRKQFVEQVMYRNRDG